MNQSSYYQQSQRQSGGGCGRIALYGGGCLVVVLIGFVGIIVAGSLFWDRGVDAGGNLVSNWVSDQFGTDIGERADSADEVTADLPDARSFGDGDSYLEFLDAYHREFAASMERVAELVQNPQLRNDDWQDDLAREIAVIRHLEDEARDVDPPEDFQDAHEHWVTGMGEYRQAIDSTASAMDELSPTQFAEAIGSLTMATRSYIHMAENLEQMGALDELREMEELREMDLDEQ